MDNIQLPSFPTGWFKCVIGEYKKYDLMNLIDMVTVIIDVYHA